MIARRTGAGDALDLCPQGRGLGVSCLAHDAGCHHCSLFVLMPKKVKPVFGNRPGTHNPGENLK
jgi:hypothetical protein